MTEKENVPVPAAEVVNEQAAPATKPVQSTANRLAGTSIGSGVGVFSAITIDYGRLGAGDPGEIARLCVSVGSILLGLVIDIVRVKFLNK
jgi:hypothetical protein